MGSLTCYQRNFFNCQVTPSGHNLTYSSAVRFPLTLVVKEIMVWNAKQIVILNF